MRTEASLLMAAIAALVACQQVKPGAVRAKAERAPTTASPAAIARIVFVGKEHACDCTRERIEASWAALQAALGASPTVRVQRLQIDTQPSEVETFARSKPLMAIPGIYFVDGRGGVIDLLQGEVKSEQISAILGGR